MASYDAELMTILTTTPTTIGDVLQTLGAIDSTCAEGDGLTWFNRLYMQVTQAVEDRVSAGGFQDAAWLAELDVQFASLYFNALRDFLAGASCPGCWSILFNARGDIRIARIQFAMAGINAHINHDLAEAIVRTCQKMGTAPLHTTAQYKDYTDLNRTLDSLIQTAKTELNVRLLGDPLPPVTHLENILAAWGTAAAREQAWANSEALWAMRNFPAASDAIMNSLDGLSTFAGKTVLVPVPLH
jgi:hypothetical protein